MDIQSMHKRIAELCKQKQWTYYRLAKECGFQQSTLKSIIKEKNMPNLYTLDKICNALNITLSDFFKSELFEDVTTINNEYISLWIKLQSADKERVLVYMYGLLHKEVPMKEDVKNDL